MNVPMRIACTLSAAAALVAIGLNQGAADAQTAGIATAGSAGVTGSAGLQTGAISPSAFGTGTASMGAAFSPPGAAFVFDPASAAGAASFTTPNATVSTPNGSAVALPNNGTVTMPAEVGPSVVAPYYIYVPYPMGGGPGAGYGYTPAQPGGAASESVVAPESTPQPDYRSVPGGRANFDLDDPYFRNSVSR